MRLNPTKLKFEGELLQSPASISKEDIIEKEKLFLGKRVFEGVDENILSEDLVVKKLGGSTCVKKRKPGKENKGGDDDDELYKAPRLTDRQALVVASKIPARRFSNRLRSQKSGNK